VEIRTIALLCLALLASGQILAQARPDVETEQSPIITHDSAASSAELQQWLHSGQPRLVAWAATLAREHQDKTALVDAPEILRDWPRDPLTGEISKTREQRDAVSALLDAMIQLKMPVTSIPAFEAIERTFTAQTAILAAYAPEETRKELFARWLSFDSLRVNVVDPSGVLGRVAAMFSALHPPPGFALSILKNAEEQVYILIVREGSKFERKGYGIGGPCADTLGKSVAPGWPVVFRYALDERSVNGPGVVPSKDQVLIQAGGRQIAWQRSPSNQGYGSCTGVAALTAEVRHELLAEMLDEPESALPWPVRATRTIVWQDEQQVQLAIGKIVEKESSKQRQTLLALMEKGLIMPDEVEASMPKIVVHIDYDPTVPSQ